MTGPVEDSPDGSFHGGVHRAQWIVVALVLFIVLVGFLLPLLNLGRYHRTIADSLTRSLGHTVHLDSVNLAVFPLPGLVIHDLTVEEDPSFGAEPLLRAPTVTVFLRLSSLWRQRLEISRIDLDDASVNLVRDPSGRWNFSSLLLQASRTATAPTAQRRPGSALRFPYIEFSNARINFKKGNVKEAFSLLNANANVWLADSNHWRIRLAAQPARTDLDLDLEDTGTVRLEGSLTRADSLDLLPLDLHAEWTGAQLGQVSRLMLGSDSGWRGDLRVDTDITGDIHDLVLHSRLRVDDAHRLEFTPINQLNINARCDSVYHHSHQSLDNLTCLWPTGDGHLLLIGAVQNLAHPQPHLNLEINHTPVAFAVSLLGVLRSTLPQSLDASGTINGDFSLNAEPPSGKSHQPAAPANILTGHAVADTVAIRISGMDQPVTFADLRFATPTAPSSAAPRRAPRHPAQPALPANVVLLEPATFPAGSPTPMQVSGQFTRSGFSLHFTGESAIAQLQPVARDLSQFRAIADLTLKGIAQVDLTFAGPWVSGLWVSGPGFTGFGPVPVGTESGAAIQGWARLQYTEIKPAWMPEPIEISAATAQFGNQPGSPSARSTPGNTITWSNASVSVDGIEARGSASYPVTCDNPSGCPAQINLDFPTLDSAALQSALLGTGRHGELVNAILSRVESPSAPWPALNGTIHAGTLSIASLKLSNVRAAIAVDNGRLNIVSLDAATLGGSTHVTGSIQKSSDGPLYALNLTCSDIKLTEVATLFHEKWGTGSIGGQANLSLHGYSDLAASATGDFRWILNGTWAGTWPENVAEPALLNASLNPPQELTRTRSRTSAKPAAASWTAAGTISNQTLILSKGPAQGTISFDRRLDLDWTALGTGEAATENATEETAPEASKPTPAFLRITGTLAHPAAIAPTPSQEKTHGPRGN